MGHLKNFTIKFLIVLALTIGFTFLAYKLYENPKIGVDDANITFVYARNFSNGEGFVYNVGGERVEGFTTMLWVLITSVFFLLSDTPETAILILNIFIIAFGITYALQFLEKHLSKKKDKYSLLTLASAVFLSWIFITPNFVAWSIISLMEAGIYSILLLLQTIMLLEIITDEKHRKLRLIIFSLIIILLLLVRPESMLWVPIFLFILYFGIRITSQNFNVPTRHSLLPIISFITALVGLTVFRLIYFGYPLPNTYYAKVSSDITYNLLEGVEYFIAFFNSSEIVGLAFALCVIPIGIFIMKLYKFIKSRDFEEVSNEDIITLSLAIIIMIGALIPIYNGGDHFNQFRFYQPIWPVLIIFLMFFLKAVSQRIRLNITDSFEISFSAFVIATFFIYSSNYISWDQIHTKEKIDESIDHEFRTAEIGRSYTSSLNDFFEVHNEYPSIGVITAGGSKFSYRGDVIDLMGLNNTKMAHSDGDRTGLKNHAAFNKDVFFELSPALINFEWLTENNYEIPGKYQKGGGVYNIFKGLYDEPEFINSYTPVIVSRKNYGQYLFAYANNDFLHSLSSRTFEIKAIR